MSISKENLNNFLPNGFETENKEDYKMPFDEDLVQTGYERDVPDIVSGPNLNNLIDVVGKNTNILNKYVEYLNNMPINSIPTVDNNNQLIYVNNNFLNKTQITNCILEAPNGVMEVASDGYNFTLKQGLKVLIPNGRNTDGTLKSIEITLNNDSSYTGFNSNTKTSFYLFVDEQGVGHSTNVYLIGKDENKPTITSSTGQSYTYFAIDTNKIYLSVDTNITWTEVKWCFLGNSSTFSKQDIVKFYPLNPINLATKDEIDGNWVYSNVNLLNNITMTSTQVIDVDISSIIPNDGNSYEIIITGDYNIPSGAGNQGALSVYSDVWKVTLSGWLGRAKNTISGVVGVAAGQSTILVDARRVLYFRQNATNNITEVYARIIAYRKVR